MATIRARKRTDGSVSYTAQIRLFRDGAQVYQESQIFARKEAAKACVRNREINLDQPGAIERANRTGATIKEMIERYLAEMKKVRPLGKTKLATLNAIGESYLGKLHDKGITSQKFVEYTLWRMSEEGGDVKPQTHFQGIQARRPTAINMLDVAGFALFSTRRQEEITRIQWADLDEVGHRVLVRDMKKPGQKIGNDVWCHLPPEALIILQKRIFFSQVGPLTIEKIHRWVKKPSPISRRIPPWFVCRGQSLQIDHPGHN